MGGEGLDAVELDQRGLVGDRWFAVEDEHGHFASGKRTRRFRRHDEVFGYRAWTTPDGRVEVIGQGGSWHAGQPALNVELARAMGVPVRVTAESDVPHQDAGAVSLVGTATLAWCAEHLGVDADPKRLRVNIVFESDEPFIEESWLGRTVRVGDASLRFVARTVRCRMIDVAQDGVIPQRRWLKPLAKHRAMSVAVYADVARPGQVRLGDTLETRALTVPPP